MAAWLFSASAEASPQSRELIRQGAEAMQRGDNGGAAALFRRAQAADPADADALAFLAAIANREGRPAEALDLALRAKDMRGDHPDLDFELGWAQINTGAYVAGIASLGRYEAANPGRGLTSELQGRGHLALGRYGQARASFEEAMRRDPRLTDSALFLIAQTEAARGQRAAATTALARMAREQPDSPLTRRVMDTARAAGPETAAKPWEVTLLTGIGYNNNVIGTGNDVPTPPDISGRASGFGRMGAEGSYTLRDGRMRLAFRYAFLNDRYFRLSLRKYDTMDHFPRVEWNVRLTPDLAAGLLVGDQYTELAGNAFRNAFIVRPSLSRRLNSWAVLEGSYTASMEHYSRQPLFPVWNRSGDMHTAAATAYLAPQNRFKARGWIGYARTWRETEGTDYSGTSDILRLGVNAPVAWDVVADLTYAHSFDRYYNLNSFAGPSGNAFKRSDDIDTVSLQLTRPLWGPLKVYGRYDYVNDSSNVNIFDFDQHVFIGGLIANF